MSATRERVFVSSFQLLPTEILVNIFRILTRLEEQKQLNVQSLLCCSLVCTEWRDAAFVDQLWKRAALERWAIWGKNWKREGIDPLYNSSQQGTRSWRSIYLERSNKDNQMKNLLDKICKFPQERISARKYISYDLSEDVEEALSILVENESKKPFENLDLKYYSTRILKRIRMKKCLDNWVELLENLGNSNIEDGAIIITRGKYHNTKEGEIESRLDSIANNFLNGLGNDKVDTLLRVDPLQLLRELNAFLFDSIGLKGDDKYYYTPENSYLIDVLTRKLGIPISLSVIYSSIARRVGIKLEPIGMPTHFLLKYTTPQGEGVFIDAFGKGRFLTVDDCRLLLEANNFTFRFRPDFLNPVTNFEVWSRMIRNLVEVYKHSGETENLFFTFLQSLVFDRDLPKYDYANIHLSKLDCLDRIEDLHLMQYTRPKDKYIENMIQGATVLSLNKLPEPETRTPLIKYHVGSVFRHAVNNYRGVICGWNRVCSASRAWRDQMGILANSSREKQPFYHCLLQTDQNTYISHYIEQENIIIDKEGGPIDNPLIGRYFVSFVNEVGQCHYNPNSELKEKYPYDSFE